MSVYELDLNILPATPTTAVWGRGEIVDRDKALQVFRRERVRLSKLIKIMPKVSLSIKEFHIKSEKTHTRTWLQYRPEIRGNEPWIKAYEIGDAINYELYIATEKFYKKDRKRMSPASRYIYNLIREVSRDLHDLSVDHRHKGFSYLESISEDPRDVLSWAMAAKRAVKNCITYLEYGGFEASMTLPDEFQEKFEDEDTPKEWFTDIDYEDSGSDFSEEEPWVDTEESDQEEPDSDWKTDQEASDSNDE